MNTKQRENNNTSVLLIISKILNIYIPLTRYVLLHFNPLNTKRRLLYLKTQFVPRSKHFSSRL